MVFCPKHPKRDQIMKFTPLSETTNIPASFIWEFPPHSPPPGNVKTEPSVTILVYPLFFCKNVVFSATLSTNLYLFGLFEENNWKRRNLDWEPGEYFVMMQYLA